ncbi:uncharacterized protein LOC143018400 [Oratosquilla oratoria]|uniref:uncharacterized protein LOC143018400 n=1 Tax=Oratosquilla oratoria TaxID=337810 RepID=UPI003F769193
MNNHHLCFRKTDDTAVIPSRATPKSVGYDLSSKQNGKDITVKAHGKAMIETGLSITFPEGWSGRIAPRSGMAWKNFTTIGAGIIDPDYDGEVKVVIFNHADTDLHIEPGQRVAQLILCPVHVPPVKEILADGKMEILENEPDRVRGTGGFGSTGCGALTL